MTFSISGSDFKNQYLGLKSEVQWSFTILRNVLNKNWKTCILYLVFNLLALLYFYLLITYFGSEWGIIALKGISNESMDFWFWATLIALTLPFSRLLKILDNTLYRWLTHVLFLSVAVLLLYYIPASFPQDMFFWFWGPGNSSESSRAAVSMLVQAEATILAIVSTLSLVALQQSAAAYSPQAINIFKRNPDIWIFLVTYAGSIIYGFSVLKGLDLKTVQDPELIGMGSVFSPEEATLRVYLAGFFALVVLVLYIKNTLDLLKPSSIIRSIGINITPSAVEAFVLEDLPPAESPVRQLIDVVNTSLARYDSDTASTGILELVSRINEVTHNKTYNDEDTRKIQKVLISDLSRFGILAVRNRDKDNTVTIAIYLDTIFNEAIRDGNRYIMAITAESIRYIGTEAVNQQYEEILGYLALELEKMGIASVRQKYEDEMISIALQLMYLGTGTNEKCTEATTNLVLFRLRNLGIEAAINKSERCTRILISRIAKIELEAAVLGRLEVVVYAVNSLYGIARETKREKMDQKELILSSTGTILKTAGENPSLSGIPQFEAQFEEMGYKILELYSAPLPSV